MRRPQIDPVEIVAVGLPVLLEAVAVSIMIGCAMALVAIFSSPAVPV